MGAFSTNICMTSSKEYKGLKGDLIPKTRRCRNQHSMAFLTPIANTDVYNGNFSPPDYQELECPPRFSDHLIR